MNIYSDDDEMTAVTDDFIVKWVKGTHTAQVFAKDGNPAHDVFTFAWEKDKPDMLDFTTSLENYLEYANEAN